MKDMHGISDGEKACLTMMKEVEWSENGRKKAQNILDENTKSISVEQPPVKRSMLHTQSLHDALLVSFICC